MGVFCGCVFVRVFLRFSVSVVRDLCVFGLQ